MNKELKISEPWDFSSSDGDNIIKIIILKKNEYGLICKPISVFNGMRDYLLLQERDKYGNYNIYMLDDCDRIELCNYNFKMIGNVILK